LNRNLALMIDAGKNTFGIRLLRGTLLLLMRVLFRIKHSGMERIPGTGALLIVANHVTYFDPVWIGVRCYRTIHFMAWDRLFGFPPAGWLLRAFGAFPVSLENPEYGAYKTALRVLQDGKALVIFPEGGRSPDGRLKPFKEGAAHLALKTGASILPVVIHGGERIWNRKMRFPRPGKVWVEFLDPIPQDHFAGTADELTVQVRRAMEERLNPAGGGIVPAVVLGPAAGSKNNRQ
jgi:1-acyl-sn-glycerol-3-phosphate acyltransferase